MENFGIAGNLDTQIPESSVPELLKIPFQVVYIHVSVNTKKF